MMNLYQLPKFKASVIVDFLPELDRSHQRRLRELGFREGQTVSCIRNNPFGGSKVYSVGGSVFSLSSDIAKLVSIKELL